MSDVCTFRDRTTPPCPKPATHRVTKGWLRPYGTWRIEEASEPETTLTGATADIQASHGHQVPEFCLSHAATVMDHRNHQMKERL